MAEVERVTFGVPTETYIRQGKVSQKQLKEEKPAKLEELAKVGIDSDFQGELEKATAKVEEEDIRLDKAIVLRGKEIDERDEVLEALVQWRKKALKMARLAFGRNSQYYNRFRPGKLKSHRVPEVQREAKILVQVARRFEKELTPRGGGPAFTEEGRKLYESLSKEDVDVINAAEDVAEIAGDLSDSELALCALLVELEDAGDLVFDDNPYRLNVIRDYSN